MGGVRRLRESLQRVSAAIKVELGLWSMVATFVVLSGVMAIVDPTWASFYGVMDLDLGWQP